MLGRRETIAAGVGEGEEWAWGVYDRNAFYRCIKLSKNTFQKGGAVEDKSVKHLSYKHQRLGLIPSTQESKSGAAAHTCNPNTEEVKIGGRSQVD